MKKTIVLATANPKKAIEVKRMAEQFNIEVICLADIPEATGIPQAEENGSTFIENAEIKARYWRKILRKPVIAEDSGLCIKALNGYPGTQTKRCIKEFMPDVDIDVNVDNPDVLYPLLLKAMKESGSTTKVAKWVSSMVYVDEKKTFRFEESLYGSMCHCRGERRFGFDQYFMPLGYNKTLAELDPSEKDEIGPRKKVLERIFRNL